MERVRTAALQYRTLVQRPGCGKELDANDFIPLVKRPWDDAIKYHDSVKGSDKVALSVHGLGHLLVPKQVLSDVGVKIEHTEDQSKLVISEAAANDSYACNDKHANLVVIER